MEKVKKMPYSVIFRPLISQPMDVGPHVSFDDTAIAFLYKSNSALKRANFIFTLVNNPFISKLATVAVKIGLSLQLPIQGLVRSIIFNHFCGGETIEQCESLVRNLSKYGVGAILDYSVEGEDDEGSLDKTAAEIIKMFETSKDNESLPFCVFKMTGIAKTSLLEKIQKKATLTGEEIEAFERVRERVDKICLKAYEYKSRVLIDAEETWIQNSIDRLTYEMMQKYNKDEAVIFNTFQMYRTDMLTNLRDAHHNATMHNYYLGVKMVRGAYMEKERERAEKMNYSDPIQPSKQATDDSFNRGLAFCIDNKQRVSLMCGSHNDYSNRFLTVLMEKHGMNNNDKRVWFAQLYGMSDNISFNLAGHGYNVAKYVPYGPLDSMIPYLLRRVEENTSVVGQSSRELMLIRNELRRRKKSS